MELLLYTFLLNRFSILLTIHYSPPALSCLQACYGSSCPLGRGQCPVSHDASWPSRGTTTTVENMHLWCVWARVYACVVFGRQGVFWNWMRSHPCLRGRKWLWGLQASGHQWAAHANSHTAAAPPPMFLNYTIVLSHSILPRLVRHHLLSPQKAL